MKFVYLLALASMISACASSDKSAESAAPQAAATPAPKKLPTTIEEAVASEYRTPENRQRDGARHPVETLTFFGLKPEMTVVEISPGMGWYSQILAPLLAEKGKYYAAQPAGDGEYLVKMRENYTAWLKANPELESKVVVTSLNPGKEPIAPDGTADMVVTFRNVHNWISNGVEAAAFKSFHKALKPGGILGVVEHRENPKKKRDPKAKNGYVLEKDVIRMAEKAGFKLVEKSEVNANPRDTKDHPEGVWTLPPTYRLGDKDREKYAAIGESDRMTLKFVKK